VAQAIDDKLVKGLVIGSLVRISTLPDLPTLAEAALPEFEVQGWNGLFAPKVRRRRSSQSLTRRRGPRWKAML
jgi:tripartite-type tricarboxylate transporter receptor subunit TctC